MSTYRLLADHYINNQLLPAGTTQTTADIPGGLLPANWQPSNAVEPLDTPAVNAFYAAGPQLLGLLRGQSASDLLAMVSHQRWNVLPTLDTNRPWRWACANQRIGTVRTNRIWGSTNPTGEGKDNGKGKDERAQTRWWIEEPQCPRDRLSPGPTEEAVIPAGIAQLGQKQGNHFTNGSTGRKESSYGGVTSFGGHWLSIRAWK